MLASLGCLDQLADSFESRGPSRRSHCEGRTKTVYSAETLLTLILDADLLRDQQRLRESLQFAIRATAPAVIKESMLKLMQHKRAVPHDSLVRKARFSLDAAFSIWSRQLLTGPAGRTAPWLFLWSDASPQGSWNWSLSQLHLFFPDELSQFYDSWRLLVARHEEMLVASALKDHEEESDADWTVEEDRADSPEADHIELDDGGVSLSWPSQNLGSSATKVSQQEVPGLCTCT